METKKRKTTITITASPETVKELEGIASHSGLDKSKVVSALIRANKNKTVFLKDFQEPEIK